VDSEVQTILTRH